MEENNISKKEEQVLNKEFHNLNKTEEIEIKQLETSNKLNETNAKMGKKIEKPNILDNSTKKGKFLRTLIVILALISLIVGGYFY